MDDLTILFSCIAIPFLHGDLLFFLKMMQLEIFGTTVFQNKIVDFYQLCRTKYLYKAEKKKIVV